jgi:hypothetical protein
MGFCSMAGGGVGCDASEAFGALLLRGAGSAFASFASFASAALRGLLGFFSGALGSFGFGLGPGFLRGWPLAVRR